MFPMTKVEAARSTAPDAVSAAEIHAVLEAAQTRFENTYQNYLDIHIGIWHTLTGLCVRDYQWRTTNRTLHRRINDLLTTELPLVCP